MGTFSLLSRPELEIKKPHKFRPIHENATHYSSGSEDFDEFLGGGLKKGLFMLLETGHTVGNDWHRPIYEMLRANFLLNGGSCLIAPSAPVTPQMILAATIPFVGKDIVSSRLRIVSYAPTIKHPSIVDVRGKNLEDVFNIQARAVQELKRRTRKETLWILSMDTYEVSPA